MPSLDLCGVTQSTRALRQLVAEVRAAGTRRDHEGAGRVEAVLARRRGGARLRHGFGGRVAWPGDGRRGAWRRGGRRRVGAGRGSATGPALLSTPGWQLLLRWQARARAASRLSVVYACS